jgi:5'-nucleotidase
VRRLLPGIAATAAASLVALLGPYAQADPRSERVKLRLLGVNDLHGHLEPPKPGVGGAAWLKSHLDQAELPGRTIRVHAGDMVGASPLISGWFHDEPSIEAANQIGFDVGTVGNHEFDEGGDELLRLLRGGQRTGPEALKRDVSGSLVNTSSPAFAGARFPYIGANTFDRDGELLLPPYLIQERAGVKVGFIGVTTESTPRFLLTRHSERFRFTDISEAVNRWIPSLRGRGVEAIVVLAHAGAPTPQGMNPAKAAGEIIDEVREMDDAVDVVIAGHSHSLLNLTVAGKLVVEADSYGVAYDLVDIDVDRRTGDVVRKTAKLPATGHSLPQDRGVAALVDRYADRVRPLGDHALSHTGEPLTRMNGRLGSLIADAQRAFARADAALVSTASMRGDIDPGTITYADVAEVQSYDHRVMKVTLSGRKLLRLRADGLHFAGPPQIDPAGRYVVAVSELLASSAAFDEPQGHPIGSEIEALAWYLERRSRRR